jgi:hypothetical protein
MFYPCYQWPDVSLSLPETSYHSDFLDLVQLLGQRLCHFHRLHVVAYRSVSRTLSQNLAQYAHTSSATKRGKEEQMRHAGLDDDRGSYICIASHQAVIRGQESLPRGGLL